MGAMVPPSYTAVCTSVRVIARDVVETRFAKPEGFTFVPGQFVLFDVPLIGAPHDVQPRAYSVASAPAEEELLFVFKLTPGGRASRWVSEALQPGDTVRLQRAMGLFRLHEGDAPVALVCTSTGAAPFRSMLLHLAASGAQRTVDLLFGVRAEEDRFWVDELDAFAAAHPWFHVHWALTRPSGSWQGLTGRVQEVCRRAIPDVAEREVLACGNPGMTAELKRLCGEWGMPRERVHVEGYI